MMDGRLTEPFLDPHKPCDFYPEYRRHAPEGRFAHYLMLLGAIGGRSCRARGERCSAYESSLGTGQVHVVFDP